MLGTGRCEGGSSQADPEAIPLLLEMLEEEEGREKAARTLTLYGPQALPHLAATLDIITRDQEGRETPGSLYRRRKALEILGRIPGEESLRVLMERLEDPELGVDAALVLAGRGYPEKVLDRLVVKRLVEGFCGGDPYYAPRCGEAITSLEGIMDLVLEEMKEPGRLDPVCIENLIHLLAHKNPRLAEDRLSELILREGLGLSRELLEAIARCREFRSVFREAVEALLEDEES